MSEDQACLDMLFTGRTINGKLKKLVKFSVDFYISSIIFQFKERTWQYQNKFKVVFKYHKGMLWEELTNSILKKVRKQAEA